MLDRRFLIPILGFSHKAINWLSPLCMAWNGSSLSGFNDHVARDREDVIAFLEKARARAAELGV